LSDHGSRRAAGLPGYSEDAGALLCLRQHGHGTGTQPGDEHLRAPALYPARRAAADDPCVREEWRAPSADRNGKLYPGTCAAGITLHLIKTLKFRNHVREFRFSPQRLEIPGLW